jgi:hypothetical protein
MIIILNKNDFQAGTVMKDASWEKDMGYRSFELMQLANLVGIRVENDVVNIIKNRVDGTLGFVSESLFLDYADLC